MHAQERWRSKRAVITGIGLFCAVILVWIALTGPDMDIDTARGMCRAAHYSKATLK